MATYAKYLNRKETPATMPIPGREHEQVKTSDGGYAFEETLEMRVKRFLLIGTKGGSYYASEQKLTLERLNDVRKLLNENYKLVLDMAAELSKTGRLVKNETAIAVLAMGLSHDKAEVRCYAATKFNDIIRIPTHLFIFLNYIKGMRGWGRLLKNVIAEWYRKKADDTLVYHILKYQRREGWSHIDAIRLAHVKPANELQDALFGWLAGYDKKPDHPLFEAFVKLRQATKEDDVIGIINEYKVTWEFVPTKWLGKERVWKALLPNLPFTALIRNLGRMTNIGVLKPFTDETELVISKLTDEKLIKHSKIHPIQAAIALRTYSRGEGLRGRLKWIVDNRIVQALNETVMLAFHNVESTGKRYLLGLDVSASMECVVCCEGLVCSEVSAIMALATVKAEDRCYVHGFCHEFVSLPFTKSTQLQQAMEMVVKKTFGATNCSLPMIHALEHEIPIDVFVIYTDNEFNTGKMHPTQALAKYRSKMGIPAKLIVVGMVANEITIIDPVDPLQLGICGFDPAVPKLISEYASLI